MKVSSHAPPKTILLTSQVTHFRRHSYILCYCHDTVRPENPEEMYFALTNFLLGFGRTLRVQV